MTDNVNHPAHYTSHPSGKECFDVVQYLPAALFNAAKYIWRAGLKGNGKEDVAKAVWYLKRYVSGPKCVVTGKGVQQIRSAITTEWQAWCLDDRATLADTLIHLLLIGDAEGALKILKAGKDD